MAVLALVIAALLGLLLVNRFQLRRQLASYNDLSQQYSALSEAHEEQKASYSELTRQYSALSEAHDVLKERCDALEQTVRDAQGRAESAKRELEALRQQSVSAEPTPQPTPESTPAPTQKPTTEPTMEPTEQPGTSVAVQGNPDNE